MPQIESTRLRTMMSFIEAYRGDGALRSRAEEDPRAALAEHGIDLPVGPDLRIVADTAKVFHLVMPPDPNAGLADESLDTVAGGKTAGVPGLGYNADGVLVITGGCRATSNAHPVVTAAS